MHCLPPLLIFDLLPCENCTKKLIGSSGGKEAPYFSILERDLSPG